MSVSSATADPDPIPPKLTAFEKFVKDAVALARGGAAAQLPVTASHPLLNGAPYSVFRREVGIDTRREIGAFFSSDGMSRSLAAKLLDRIDDGALVLDPTCGIGDLLLARASHLQIGATLIETVSAWGERLAGFDTRADLIQLAKVRLCLLARARGAFTAELDPLEAFPLIQVGDMFAPESQGLLARADAVLFNPPFGKTTWPLELSWASGEINAAAIFLDHLTNTVKSSTPIAAVLPEVLRCGSRYNRFRSTLTERGYSGVFEAQGRFDTWTDVDVFTTLLIQSRVPPPLWRTDGPAPDATVEDLYEVRVGTVVPHRDPKPDPATPISVPRRRRLGTRASSPRPGWSMADGSSRRPSSRSAAPLVQVTNSAPSPQLSLVTNRSQSKTTS